jgi:hypothetical protein
MYMKPSFMEQKGYGCDLTVLHAVNERQTSAGSLGKFHNFGCAGPCLPFYTDPIMHVANSE